MPNACLFSEELRWAHALCLLPLLTLFRIVFERCHTCFCNLSLHCWEKFASDLLSHFFPWCSQSLGFDLLARSNYHWQLCFSRAEHILMEGLDEDGGCRMKCFRVMRQMKEDVWCAGNKPVITAYHLQVGITLILTYSQSRDLLQWLPSSHVRMLWCKSVEHLCNFKVTVKTAVPFNCFTVVRSSLNMCSKLQ